MDEIRALIDEINGILAAMSKEKRLRFFKQYPVPLEFAKEIDDTTYLVTVPLPRALRKRRRVL